MSLSILDIAPVLAGDPDQQITAEGADREKQDLALLQLTDADAMSK